MTLPPILTVREMELADVDIRIDYFHDASDDHLRMLGVDRALLPSREEWHQLYEADCARPIRERINYSLVWERDGQAVGFSSTDEITFHLDPDRRVPQHQPRHSSTPLPEQTMINLTRLTGIMPMSGRSPGRLW